MCHPEAKPKDLANEKEILHFVQNDKPPYVIVNKPVLEQREGTVMINIQS
jgi:hypothetical protein